MSHTAKTEPVEFKNDQIHVIVHHKPACRIELKVKAAPSLIQTARSEAGKAVSKEVSLPGFRKGRAPAEMVLKKFPAQVEKEMHKKLADVTFVEAQKLTQIPLLNNQSRITFDLQKMEETGAELLFSFETEPTIPTVDPKAFQPQPVERAEVGDKEIEEAIRQMRFFFATWTPVVDRPIQEKDYIMIHLDTIDEGAPPVRVFDHVRFEVSKERMAEWMQKIVIGKSPNEVLEGMSEPDERLSEEEKKEFQPKKVRITVLKVEQATLPELDDAFAQKVGASDLFHMRQSITNMLNRQADDKAHEMIREQVNEFLIQHYPFDVPESLVRTEKEHRLKHLFQIPDFQRDWKKMTLDEKKAFEDKMTRESATSVRLFYISRQVVRDAKIGIRQKEVQDEAVATLRTHGVEKQIPVDQIPKEVYALALSKLILARAQDYIIQKQKEA